MKNRYRIFIGCMVMSLAVLFACAHKLGKEQLYNPTDPNGFGYDTLYIDHDADGIPDIRDEEPAPQSVGPIDIEHDRLIMMDETRMVEESMQIRMEETATFDASSLNNDTRTVEDKATPIKPTEGLIAYSVPNEMAVGIKYPIKLRISKEQNKTRLVVGDRNMPINDVSIDSKVTIEAIRVEPIMTAKLYSSNGAFDVSALSTETQNIEDNGYTEWSWVVKPLRTGRNYLKMIVKVKIKSDGETYYKDIVVFDKNIKVKANIKHGVSNWISNHWQWFMTTIIIPIVIFFYKRRKKKKEES